MSVRHRKWNTALIGTVEKKIEESNRQTAIYSVLTENIIGQNEIVMDRAGTREELWTPTCGKCVYKAWQCQSVITSPRYYADSLDTSSDIWAANDGP
jgi:hypothetical protein